MLRLYNFLIILSIINLEQYLINRVEYAQLYDKILKKLIYNDILLMLQKGQRGEYVQG